MFAMKHVVQMNSLEVDKCFSKVKRWKLEAWNITDHTLIRLREKEIEGIHLAYSLIDFSIIEYKQMKSGNERIVIRSNMSFNGFNVCTVLDITTGTVITAWKNRVTDTHRTLDLSKYDECLTVR